MASEIVRDQMKKGFVTKLEIEKGVVMVWLQVDREKGRLIEQGMNEVDQLRFQMLKDRVPEKYPFLTDITDPSTIKLGTVCLFKNKRGRFSRVRVLGWDVPEKKVVVYCMDYGHTTGVHPSTLRIVNEGVPYRILPDTCSLFYVAGIHKPRNGGWKEELVDQMCKFTRYTTVDFYHVDEWDKETADPKKKYFIQMFYEFSHFNDYIRAAALEIAKKRHDVVVEKRKQKAAADKDNYDPQKKMQQLSLV